MTSISNGESGLSVRTKLNASLTVTDAFTVSGANVGIGASSPQSVLNVEKSSSANTISAATSVILSNRNETAGTFLAGGVFSNTYRDVSTTCYTAGVWFEKQTSAANGAFSSQGAIIFGTNDSPGSGAFPSERMRVDASGNVGIGTTSPASVSIVDVQSTTKGVRFPNMTTAEKNAIANVSGNVVFDTTLGKLCVNSGSGWQTITSI